MDEHPLRPMHSKEFATEGEFEVWVANLLSKDISEAFQVFLEHSGEATTLQEKLDLLLEDDDLVLNFVDKSNYTSSVDLGADEKPTKACMHEMRPNQDIGYMCLDCGVPAPDGRCNSIVCSKCFFDSHDQNGRNLHAKHRVLKVDLGGVCDCGDPTMWKSDRMCSTHSAATDHK